MNLASVFSAKATAQPDRIAIRCEGRSLTYAHSWSITERIASLLLQLGVAPGDRVGLSMAESELHVLAHYAIAYLSAVIVPIDHRWTASEQRNAACAFNARVVLTDGSDIDGIRCAALTQDTLPPAAGALPAIEQTNSDLVLSLSSGTTGKPKGALVTHQHLYERFVSQWHAIGYGADDTFAILTPLYFGAGRSFSMCMLAAGGGLVIAPPPLKPPQVVAALQAPGITAAFVPPTLLRRLFELHKTGSQPLLAHLNYLIVSGEPLFADEARRCIETICPNLFGYYASSEGGGISVLRAEDFATHADSVGRPTYQTDVEIVDEQDRALQRGRVGRLRYRGPGVSTRYLDADGTEQDSASGGWFYPGDLAKWQDDGFIALCGRDKDVIIRGGINIYPAEIEAVLLEHAAVREAAVIGLSDTDRGEIVCAYVAGDVNAEALSAWCLDRLAPYKRPGEFVFIEQLPKRSSGKVDKNALRDKVVKH